MSEPTIDPGRPTPVQNNPNGNGQHYDDPAGVGMSPQQVIKLMLANGFAGWGTEIVLTRPTQNGPEKYATTPAKLLAENTRAVLALNHTLQLFLQGAIPVESEDDAGNVIMEEVNPIQAIVDLTASIDESCNIAESQLQRKPRQARKRKR